MDHIVEESVAMAPKELNLLKFSSKQIQIDQ